MATTARIDVGAEGPVRAVQGFLKQLLEKSEVQALLTPRHLPIRGTVMPTLVSDPEELDQADPMSPSYPLNGAKMIAKLTKGYRGRPVAAVLRSCEIRAFIELVKLNQGGMDNVMIIGVDCLGAMSNQDYRTYAAAGDPIERTEAYVKAMLDGKSGVDGIEPAKACKACEHPVPEGADLILGLVGGDPAKSIQLIANTPRGEGMLTRLGFSDAPEAATRAGAVESLIAERIAYRDNMFEKTREATGSLKKLSEYLAGCVNCYNCRVACPVCYCKECVFLTDVFDYKPDQYIGWADKRGALKMPTDTVFFHLTRLAHMSTSCVGCGQCSNACPNDVPVMELFRSVAHETQKAFDYEPGRSPDEAPPMTVFREHEFSEVVGGGH